MLYKNVKIQENNESYFETPTTRPGIIRFNVSVTAKKAAWGPPYPENVKRSYSESITHALCNTLFSKNSKLTCTLRVEL